MRPLPSPAPGRAARWLVTSLAVGASAVGFAACRPDPNARAVTALRDSIKIEIAKGVHAVITKNIDEYLDQVPDEALPLDEAGVRTTRDAVRRQIVTGWMYIDTTRVLEIRIDSLTPMGDSALVVTSMRWDRFMKRNSVALDTLVTAATHREMWRRTPIGWRSVRMLGMSGKSTRNGVVIH